MDLIKIAEEAFATGKQHPSFKAGDTITVAYRERVQLYRGVVIKISGHGEKKRFTVRKMSGTVGVERIFPLESPAIDSITVNKIGKSTVSLSTRLVKYVVLNCTTCVLLPVRKLEFRKNASTTLKPKTIIPYIKKPASLTLPVFLYPQQYKLIPVGGIKLVHI